MSLALTPSRAFDRRTFRSLNRAPSLISVASNARAVVVAFVRTQVDRVGRFRHGASERARTVGIDPQEFSGFAFGFGIDRMCGLMYELDDIRLLFENDVRFLENLNKCSLVTSG